MSLNANITTGTYGISNVTLIANGGYVANSVNLVISSHDTSKNRIKGTFTAELEDFFGNIINIESANFDIAYAE